MPEDVDTYHIGRSKDESQALDDQHYRSVANVGFLLHPYVPKPSKVADLGTGTGIFLIHLSEQLPLESELVGFDISADQFRPVEQRPTNVDLRVHSFFDPFPSSELGTFDLVAIRYVVAAIDGLQGWVTTLNNAISLLKPGGNIQWLDTDPTNIKIYQQKPGTTRYGTATLVDGAKKYMRSMDRGYGVGGKRLRQLCEEAGLRNVQEDVFAIDRTIDGRDFFTKRLLQSFKIAFAVWKKQSGVQTAWTEKEWNEAAEQSEREVESGVYLHVDQICVVAQKP